MIIDGKCWKFGDDISTDHIQPFKYYHLRSNLKELSKHVLEDANPEFPKKVQVGDIVVAGKNFGLGSSREHAPWIIKLAGVRMVVASSFARIFFRNAINIGLIPVICDTESITQGDILRADLGQGVLLNLTRADEFHIEPLPEIMLKILNDGGLAAHIKKHRDFSLGI